MNTFYCPWDKISRVTTIVTSIATVGAMAFLSYKILEGEMTLAFNLTMGIVIASMVILLGVAILTSPRRLEVTDSELIIRCIGWTERIDRESILEFIPFSSKKSVRTFGSGGFFGYLWWFYSPYEGPYFSYSVNLNQQVMFVLTPRRKLVVSCERRNEFMALLRKPS